MKVFTTYFGKLRSIDGSNILPVPICKYPPKGWRGDTMPYLAPTTDILREYKDTGDWERFERRYKTEVLDKLDPDEVLTSLDECSRGGIYNIALVCYEKDPATCHRSILAKWIKDNCGICVKELFLMDLCRKT